MIPCMMIASYIYQACNHKITISMLHSFWQESQLVVAQLLKLDYPYMVKSLLQMDIHDQAACGDFYNKLQN